MEAVTLDRAGEALADRDPRDLDRVPGLERLDRDGLADGQLARAAELDQMPAWRGARLLQVPELALRELPLRDLVEGELDGLVAVRGHRLDLDDGARPGLDHGHGRDDAGLRVEDLRHAQLPSDDALHVRV